MLALNGAVVGLGVDTGSYARESADAAASSAAASAASRYPALLRDAPLCQCVGLGLVRHIDPVSRKLFVVTPVPPERLGQVNTLLRGSVDLPPSLLQQAAEQGPYLTTAPSVVGGTAMSGGRSNLERGSSRSITRG